MNTLRTDAAEARLIPVSATRQWGGVGNLVRKELRHWWGTRLWWIQVGVWVVLLNGLSAAIMLDPELGPAALVQESVQNFLLVGAIAIGIGVVLTVQGSIIGERELGTAAWVLSKPVSRRSFVVAKLIGHEVGFAVTALILPATVFVVEAAVLLPLPISLGSFSLGVAVVALSVSFYLALTLALGAIFDGRGPVAGIGIGLLLVGMFFKGMLPTGFVVLTPWLLGDVASSIALGVSAGFDWRIPVLATAIATVMLILVAIRRVDHEEF